MKLPHWLDSSATSKILRDILPPTAEWIGLRFVAIQKEAVFTRDGKADYDHSEVSWGAMVEVLVKGQFGYSATPNLSLSGLRGAAILASEAAGASAPYSLQTFAPRDVRPECRGTYRSPVTDDRSLREVRTEVLQNLLALHPKLTGDSKLISRSVAGVVLTRTEVRLVNCSGTDIRQSILQCTPHLSVTARKGNDVQTRTNFGHSAHSLQVGVDTLISGGLSPLAPLAESLSREASELIHAPNCPTGPTTLLLMPDQMMLQIHESIGHPLELDRILGDERNYAGSSFVRPSDFGSLKYGSELLNVTFDPTVAHEFASYGFDDTGAPAAREFLIRNGILERGLGGQESQVRSGIPGTANMRASSWNRPPIDRMANINLEPGDRPLDQLISSIENGILMQSNRSWSIDDYRNKFQFGCEYAREIKEGELGRVFKNPNYRGTTLPFWNSLVAIGGTDTLGTYGTPYCGKGEPNQAISVGHRSPACVFENVEVFGGEI